jgi:very-long-chain ceramide synthase
MGDVLTCRSGICLGAIGLLALAAYISPQARPLASKFLTLSHYNPNTGKYALGPADCYFVAFSMVLIIGLRAAFMSHILGPAARWLGISKEKDVARFSEQGWTLCYYSVIWPLGIVFTK